MNFTLFRDTGINHPWELYKKSSTGRVTYHRYSDDRLVSANHFPATFDTENIELCDEGLDDARKHKKLAEARQKLVQNLATARAQLAELQARAPPSDYELYLNNHQDFMASSQEFYKKIDARGTTRYFSKKTDKQVNKSNLPATVNMADIPPRTQGMMQALEFQKNVAEKIPKTEAQISNLRERLAVVEQDLAGLPVMDYETILKTHADKVAAVIARENAVRKRNMDDLMGRIHREETRRARPDPPPTRPDPPSPRPTTQTTDKNEAEKILKTFNITTKLEWKKWLAQHHSDKGGSHVLTQEVINAGKAVYG